ncbi:MAG: pantetheine-phosphate adenylyltransferase [Acidimicrobiia bacterium]|nr:pantetheine-phosphate adenylyltransferase [Acidimicrobiia bacterium]MDH5421330.1 pantetheine-phosphate adenylyltransferase [Acidimicrobiia bacterium]MDH5502868.1 pantetheine-phosphate adenylyltransferase [Acidimicrobiia bacterium]
MTMALCAGSFDPPTNGHLDLIDRAATMFDEVVVGVVSNPSKIPRLSADRRQQLLADLLADQANVRIEVFSGLVVELATSLGADVIVKGVRGVSDFDVETQMAHMNRQLSGINTVFLPTSPAVAHISSSLVKEIFALGGSIEGLVPPSVTVALEE